MVPLYGQSYPRSCWAASMRMILASRGRMVASDDAIAAATMDTGFLYAGLDPNATKCLTYWGFRTRAPTTYTQEGFAQLVKEAGPLWVACDVRFPGATPSRPHVRVVHGVRDLQDPMALMINDPGPMNVGSRYDETYVDFVAKNELLGATEAHHKAPIYIAHL